MRKEITSERLRTRSISKENIINRKKNSGSFSKSPMGRLSRKNSIISNASSANSKIDKNESVPSSINVFCRIKPNTTISNVKNASFEVYETDLMWPIKNNTENSKDKFNFSKIFDQSCQQKEVYTYSVIPIVEKFLAGFHSAFIAYGQTNSGKTHTIIGPNTQSAEDYGMVKQAIYEVFEKLENLKTEDPSNEYSLEFCAYEIYCEKIYDLLCSKNNQSNSKGLQFSEISDQKFGSKIKGIKSVKIETYEETFKL